jgi:Protein of unknown function (DUF3455)
VAYFLRLFTPTLAFAVIVASGLNAQQIPQQLQPPESEQLFLTVHGKGDQIYTCKAEGSQYSWVFKAPEADLFYTNGNAFGKHFAGPSWMATDSSRVTGKMVASVDAPDANAIPWLLLHVTGHEGNGVLSRATSIQRLNTKGGKAPATGCDGSHVNQEVRVPYSADYSFFTPK